MRHQQKALSLITRYIRGVSSTIILRTGLGIVVKKLLQQRWRNRIEDDDLRLPDDQPEPLCSEYITLENRRGAKFDEAVTWVALWVWSRRAGGAAGVSELLDEVQELVENWEDAAIGSPVGIAAQTPLQVALKDFAIWASG
jgi:hypothetical protein